MSCGYIHRPPAGRRSEIIPGHAALFLVGLAALVAGAELLVRGASSLAARIGISPLVIGLTVVAFGTSLPELLVSLQAALAGNGDIAAGNVVGSNIANIGLILGIAAAIHPLKVQLQLLKIDVPILAAVSLLAVWVFSDTRVSREEGAALFVGIILYTGLLILLARRGTSQEVEAEFSRGVPARSEAGPRRDIALFAVGLVVLVGGARWFIDGAVGIARSLGVSEALIGLTIVAVGSSTPELITSAVAAIKKSPDIVLGNVIGSSIFNILGILGATALISPFSAAGITATDLWAMALLTAALAPILISGLSIGRVEGIFLLASYSFYLWLLWPK